VGVLAALIAALVVAFPLAHLSQISNSLSELIPWTILVPLRWPAIILKDAFAIRRRRLALDLGLFLALVIVMDCPPMLLPLFPVLFVMNRLTLGLLYWFQARFQAGGSHFPVVLLALPYLALWLVSAICLAGMLSRRDLAGDKAILTFLVFLFAGTAVLLVIGGLLILLLRFRSDTQVVAPPDFKIVTKEPVQK
jgi:hypothetical protein